MKYPTHSRILALASAVALASAPQLSADTNYTSTTSTIWNNAANWDAGIPDSADVAGFNLASYFGTLNPSGVPSIQGINVGSSSAALTIGTAGLTIGSSGIVSNSANAFTISSPVTIGANQNWANNGAGTFTFGALAGAGSNTVTLTTGAFTKNSTASTGGNLAINGATLTSATSTPVATTGLLTLTSGELNASAGRTYASSLLINGSFTLGDSVLNGAQSFTGTGVTTKSITGNNTITLDGGAVTFSGNSLSLASGSNTIFTGAANLSLTSGFTLNSGTDTLTFNSGGGTRLLSGAFADTGTLVIAGSSAGITARNLTGAGGVRVDGSTVSFNTNAGVNPNTFSGGLTIQGGGTATQTNSNSFSTGSVVTIGESATNTGGTLNINALPASVLGLNSAGSSASKLVTNNGGATNILSLTGTGTYAYDGAIANGTSSLGVTVNGSGIVQTFSGTNSYTGTTTVTAGTLLVDGTHAAGAGIYSVGAAGKLGGNGSITAVSLTTVAGSKITPGGDGVVGTAFTLTLSGGANLSASSNNTGAYIFDLAGVGASDKITFIGGTLNLGALDFSDFSFNALGGFGAGTYTLFDASSAITNTLGTTVGTIGLYNATLSYDATNFDILLTVDAIPEPQTVGMIIGGFGILLLAQRRRRNA